MPLFTSPQRPQQAANTIIVDGAGKGDFLTPGAAITFLNTQTRDVNNHWFVAVRPGYYFTESSIAIPSFTTWYNPRASDASRSWQLGSYPQFRPPAGNFTGAFITVADGARISGIAADLFTNVTPTGACSLVRFTGTTGYVDKSKLTIWCSAASQNVYAVEINNGCTMYADGTLFAVQTAAANRANAYALWAKGPFSIKTSRFHDDDQAGGTAILYDTTEESTIDFTRFGTHPKSQFASDINMAADGDLWLLYSKWWVTTGAFAANAKIQQDEV